MMARRFCDPYNLPCWGSCVYWAVLVALLAFMPQRFDDSSRLNSHRCAAPVQVYLARWNETLVSATCVRRTHALPASAAAKSWHHALSLPAPLFPACSVDSDIPSSFWRPGCPAPQVAVKVLVSGSHQQGADAAWSVPQVVMDALENEAQV